MDTKNSKDEVLAQFIAINPIDEESARFFLESSNWDLNLALSTSYENTAADQHQSHNSAESDQEFIVSEEEEEEDLSEPEKPRKSSRLASKSNSGRYNTRGSKIGTLSLSSEEDSEEERQDYFAGGEKSGVAIRAPRKEEESGSNLIDKLIKKAQDYMTTAGSSSNPEIPAQPSGFHFIGKGRSMDSSSNSTHKLGNSGENSDEPVIRNLTIWRNGFNFENGQLQSFDDPNSQALLNNILQGRAPLDLLNVKDGQAVELRITKRSSEDYSSEPQKLEAFSGSGHRLGGISSTYQVNYSSGSSSNQILTSKEQTKNETEQLSVDETKPTTQVQVRLVSGGRVVIKVNLTHRVSDIIRAVNMMKPESTNGREFILKVAFPPAVLDINATVEEAKLSNSVLVQQVV